MNSSVSSSRQQVPTSTVVSYTTIRNLTENQNEINIRGVVVAVKEAREYADRSNPASTTQVIQFLLRDSVVDTINVTFFLDGHEDGFLKKFDGIIDSLVELAKVQVVPANTEKEQYSPNASSTFRLSGRLSKGSSFRVIPSQNHKNVARLLRSPIKCPKSPSPMSITELMSTFGEMETQPPANNNNNVSSPTKPPENMTPCSFYGLVKRIFRPASEIVRKQDGKTFMKLTLIITDCERSDLSFSIFGKPGVDYALGWTECETVILVTDALIFYDAYRKKIAAKTNYRTILQTNPQAHFCASLYDLDIARPKKSGSTSRRWEFDDDDETPPTLTEMPLLTLDEIHLEEMSLRNDSASTSIFGDASGSGLDQGESTLVPGDAQTRKPTSLDDFGRCDASILKCFLPEDSNSVRQCSTCMTCPFCGCLDPRSVVLSPWQSRASRRNSAGVGNNASDDEMCGVAENQDTNDAVMQSWARNVCSRCNRKIEQSTLKTELFVPITLVDHTGTSSGRCFLKGNVAEEIMNVSLDHFLTMSDKDRLKLKWSLLFEMYRFYFKIYRGDFQGRIRIIRGIRIIPSNAFGTEPPVPNSSQMVP